MSESLGKTMFLDGFQYVFDRLMTRIETLTDDEYFWEPVPACMTARRDDSGRCRLDARLPPEQERAAYAHGVPPFTTVAWRLCHIGGEVLAGFAAGIRAGRPIRYSREDWPGSADAGRTFLRDGFVAWKGALESIPEETMWRALGPAWEPFGEDSHAALVQHVFDELVHHSAEVGVVRDLYAHHFGQGLDGSATGAVNSKTIRTVREPNAELGVAGHSTTVPS